MRPTLEPIKAWLADSSNSQYSRTRKKAMRCHVCQMLDLRKGWTWALSIHAFHASGDGYESLSRQLSLVFVCGIDVVMMNIPIPVRQ